jgi:proteasome lid subunit RPN8/RPN11
MALHLSRKHHAQLLLWAKEAGNHECCGFVMGHGDRISGVVLATNVAADPHFNFEIDPVALITIHKRARDDGTPILGYFHSHPNGLARPSAADAAQAADDGRYWLIIAAGEVSAWKPCGDGGHVKGFETVVLIVEG